MRHKLYTPSELKRGFLILKSFSLQGRWADIYRFLSFICLLFLFGCAGGDRYSSKTPAPQKATSRPYKISNSHMRNKWFYPKQHYEHVEEGYASYYGGRDVFHGRKTASGEIFDKNKLMAAHRTLPIPSMIRVTNIDPKSKGYGRSLKVRVVDRGPFAHVNKRIIDVSEKTALLLGFHREGTAKVRIETDVKESIRLAKGKTFKDDQHIIVAEGLKKPSNKPSPILQKENSPFLSVSTLNLLTRNTPVPKLSPFAHQTAIEKTSSQELVMAHQQEPHPSLKPALIQEKVVVQKSLPMSKIETTKIESPSTDSIVNIPTHESGIFVQAAAYSKVKKAESLKVFLEKSMNRKYVKVTPFKAKSGTLYRVRLGPLNSSEQAEYLLAQLEKQGHDGAYIVYE